MKNLKVTAMILAATLSAGTLMACSSDKEADNTVSTVESETVESEAEESIATESSELMEEQDMDAMTEAVLEYITVARVEAVAEDGTLELTLFELPEVSEEVADAATETTGTEAADAATETAGTEESAELNESATTEETSVTKESAATKEISATEVTAEENQADEMKFDFTSLDLSIFVEAGPTESYQPEETVMIQLIEDGAMVEAALSDIQEGDMLVMFMDENEIPNIVIYRNIAQEVVTE